MSGSRSNEISLIVYSYSLVLLGADPALAIQPACEAASIVLASGASGGYHPASLVIDKRFLLHVSTRLHITSTNETSSYKLKL